MKLTLLILSILFSTISIASNPININEHEYVFGGEKIKHYLGEVSDLNPLNILNKLDDFKSFTNIIKTNSHSDEIDWMYFELTNPDSIDIWMNFGVSWLTDIKIYKLNEYHEIKDSLHLGLNTEIDFRPKFEFKQWAPLLSKKEARGIFLISAKSIGGHHELMPIFGSQSSLKDESQKKINYSMIYFGIMIIMALYNLTLAYSLRNKLYLLYSINIICIMFSVSFAVHFPMVSYLIGEKYTASFPSVWYIVPMTVMALFTTKLFNLKESLPKLQKVMWGILGLTIINALMLFIQPIHSATALFSLLLPLFYLTLAIIGFILMRRGVPGAMPFFFSWLLFFMGIIFYIMVVQAGLFYHDMAYYSNYIASSIEAVLFAMALGARYNEIRKKEQETAVLLKNKNESLKMINNSLDSFNYHVNHDLKSLLVNAGQLNTMIIKYTKKGDTVKVLSLAERIETVVKSGFTTIKGFLSFSQITDIKSHQSEVINIKNQINSLINSNDFNIKVDFNLIGIESINMSQTAFNGIFSNFLSNTCKYSNQEPKASISVYREDDQVKFIYKDQGLGIDLSKFGKDLFSPFRRIENELETEGSGIGLYLVKRIILEYEGTIHPESKPGNGLTFYISIPEKNIS